MFYIYLNTVKSLARAWFLLYYLLLFYYFFNHHVFIYPCINKKTSQWHKMISVTQCEVTVNDSKWHQWCKIHISDAKLSDAIHAKYISDTRWRQWRKMRSVTQNDVSEAIHAKSNQRRKILSYTQNDIIDTKLYQWCKLMPVTQTNSRDAKWRKMTPLTPNDIIDAKWRQWHKLTSVTQNDVDDAKWRKMRPVKQNVDIDTKWHHWCKMTSVKRFTQNDVSNANCRQRPNWCKLT